MQLTWIVLGLVMFCLMCISAMPCAFGVFWFLPPFICFFFLTWFCFNQADKA